MIGARRRTGAFTIACCVLLVVVFFQKFNQRAFGGNMTEASKIAQLFDNKRTICIGRFLVDVPADAEVAYGPASVLYPVTVFPGKAKEMERLIAERVLEIQKEKPNVYGALSAKDSMVGKLVDGVLPGQKILFGISPASSAFYSIESYVESGDDVFMQSAEAMGAPEKYSKVIQDLNAIAPSFRSRDNSQILTEPGVCIEDGFVKDTGKSTYEMVTVGVRLVSLPGVHFSLSATNKDILVASDALEPRLKQAEQIARAEGQGAWYARIKHFRRGQREIGRWTGYEVLARMPAQGEVGEFHEFAFVSQGEPNNPYLPVLELEMHSGVEGNQIAGAPPTVSDEEAVEIWDRLTSSIRVRPVDKK